MPRLHTVFALLSFADISANYKIFEVRIINKRPSGHLCSKHWQRGGNWMNPTFGSYSEARRSWWISPMAYHSLRAGGDTGAPLSDDGGPLGNDEVWCVSLSVRPVQVPPTVGPAWGWCGSPWTRWGVFGNAPPSPSSASSSPSSSSSTSISRTDTCWSAGFLLDVIPLHCWTLDPDWSITFQGQEWFFFPITGHLWWLAFQNQSISNRR